MFALRAAERRRKSLFMQAFAVCGVTSAARGLNILDLAVPSFGTAIVNLRFTSQAADIIPQIAKKML